MINFLYSGLAQFNQLLLDTLEDAKPVLFLFATFGIFSHVIYYYVWSSVFVQPYENLPLRLVAIALLLPWLFYYSLPLFFKRYFHYYFFVSTIFLIPFFFLFMTILNYFSWVWLISMMMGLILLELLIFHWLLVLISVFVGFVLALCLIVFFFPHSLFYDFYIPDFLHPVSLIFIFGFFGVLIINYLHHLRFRSVVRFLNYLSAQFSHEISTSFLSIQSVVQLLKQNLHFQENKLTDQQIKLLTNQSIKEVIRLSDHALSFQRINLMNLKQHRFSSEGKSYFSAIHMIEQSLAMYPFGSLQREMISIRLDKKDDFIILGSSIFFTHIIHNLIKNALESVRQTDILHVSKIYIYIKKTAQDHQVWIEDNGVGIPKKQQPFLFENFLSTRKKSGNMGIGLHFCQNAMQMMEGFIRCESEPGEHTHFVLHFPIIQGAAIHKPKKEKRNLVFFFGVKNISFFQRLDGCNLICQEVLTLEDLKRALEDNNSLAVVISDSILKKDRSSFEIIHAFKALGKTFPYLLGLSEHFNEIVDLRIQKLFNVFFHQVDWEKRVMFVFFSYLSETSRLNVSICELAKIELRDKSALLVDDDHINHLLIENLLRKIEGFQLKITDQPKQAISILQKKRYDFLLSDWYMSDLTGYQMVEYLLRHQLIYSEQVIFITANDQHHDHQKSYERLNVHHFLIKPVGYPMLLFVMLSILFYQRYQNSVNGNAVYCPRQAKLFDHVFLLDFLKNMQKVLASHIEQNAFSNQDFLIQKLMDILKISLLLSLPKLYFKTIKLYFDSLEKKPLSIKKLNELNFLIEESLYTYSEKFSVENNEL